MVDPENPHAAYIAEMQAYVADLRARSAALRAPRRKRRPSTTTKPSAEHQARTDRRAKISPEDVRRIRRAHAAGESPSDLAEAYGLTRRSIHLITSRRRWAHVA